jgi:hypothetical protein
VHDREVERGAANAKALAMTNLTTLSPEALESTLGGASWGNTWRAAAVAGMGLATGEQAPSFPVLTPSGPSVSASGPSGRAPFQPLPLPGGGMATFGK